MSSFLPPGNTFHFSRKLSVFIYCQKVSFSFFVVTESLGSISVESIPFKIFSKFTARLESFLKNNNNSKLKIIGRGAMFQKRISNMRI